MSGEKTVSEQRAKSYSVATAGQRILPTVVILLVLALLVYAWISVVAKML